MGIRRKRSTADGVLNSNFSFDIFIDNYFSFFRLLSHLGVNNIPATGVLNKNRLRKCIGDNSRPTKIFQGRGDFVKLGHFDKYFIKKPRKKGQ